MDGGNNHPYTIRGAGRFAISRLQGSEAEQTKRGHLEHRLRLLCTAALRAGTAPLEPPPVSPDHGPLPKSWLPRSHHAIFCVSDQPRCPARLWVRPASESMSFHSLISRVFLDSCHYDLMRWRASNCRRLQPSGGFSSETMGAVLQADRYIQRVNANAKMLDSCDRLSLHCNARYECCARGSSALYGLLSATAAADPGEEARIPRG